MQAYQAEPWVQFLVNSCEIQDGLSGIGAGLSPSFLISFLPIIILTLLHIHLSLPSEMCRTPDQAPHCHILNLNLGFDH